jgi:fatty-acyl-CoA synthase
MLLDAATQAKVDLAGLKMLVGASALPKALAKRAMGLGADVFGGYGMSETGPLLTAAHLKSSDLAGDPDQQVEIRTRAGRTCPLVDLQIVDPNMKRLPHDGKSAGEIIVRAPWLTNGYFDNPDASEQLWAGGYLHTEDVGIITLDGYLQIKDRIKDVIKSGGEWISSLQLEDIIMQCAGVAECAVIGIKDARWGERPLALVVRDPKTEPPVRVEDVKACVMAQSDKGVLPIQKVDIGIAKSRASQPAYVQRGLDCSPSSDVDAILAATGAEGWHRAGISADPVGGASW